MSAHRAGSNNTRQGEDLDPCGCLVMVSTSTTIVNLTRIDNADALLCSAQIYDDTSAVEGGQKKNALIFVFRSATARTDFVHIF
eukprot:scaffold6007_cov183-Amphora_coffeaeformis.AAC.33